MPNFSGKWQAKISNQKIDRLRVYQPAMVKQPAKLGNNAGVVDVPNRAGYVYVRDMNGILMQVYNQHVQGYADQWVLVGYEEPEPKLLQVLSLWDTFADQPALKMSAHHLTHEWPGSDTVFVHGEQFLPFLTRLSASGGFILTLFPGFAFVGHAWQYVPNQDINFSSHVPALGAIAVLVSINASGNVILNDGTPFSTPEIMTTADFPARTDNFLAIAAVRLYSGQSEITDSDIFDLRFSGGNGLLAAPEDGTQYVMKDAGWEHAIIWQPMTDPLVPDLVFDVNGDIIMVAS
jgi:hypothetical protein